MPWDGIRRIRAEAPLIHNITNYVVINTTANALLALGASPVMAHALEEVDEMVAHARALVLNIGTLSSGWAPSMLRAGQAARRRGIPIVLDPVGAGATSMRTQLAHRILAETAPRILRGNASEIMALAFEQGAPKGVDSTANVEASLEAARALSRRYGCVVSVSGPVDLIVDGDAQMRVRNGHPMMPRVTGMGCTATALTGAFAAVVDSPLLAAAHAMVVNGIAGEIASERAEGPGTFQVHFIDALYRLREEEVSARVRLEKA